MLRFRIFFRQLKVKSSKWYMITKTGIIPVGMCSFDLQQNSALALTGNESV